MNKLLNGKIIYGNVKDDNNNSIIDNIIFKVFYK